MPGNIVLIKRLFKGFPLGGLILVAAGLVACGDSAPESKTGQDEKFAGQTIMVLAPKLRGGLISGPLIQEAARFGEQTGANIRVVRPGWLETLAEIQLSLVDPNLNYDVYLITTSWSGPLFANEQVMVIPDNIKRAIDWPDILPIYRDHVLTWNKTARALPYDGDVVILYYRKDIFENSDYAAKFQQEYGYPLQVPVTWKQFYHIAEFFHGWDWDGDGEVEYGLAGSRLSNSASMLIFLSRAAAYAKHPEDPAYYFDLDTMRSRLDTPGFVLALEEYIAALEVGPPGMINYSPTDVRRAFISGQVALAVDWANIGVDGENSPVSVVKGKVGYARLPGAEQVYNARTRAWESRPNQVTSLLGNYLLLVNKESRHPELALAFAANMSSPDFTRRLTLTAGSGINPSRHSHLNNPGDWIARGFSPEAATEYLRVLTETIAHPNHIFDIRIPGSGNYYKILDQALHYALKKELSPGTALKQATTHWEALTDALGRENQRTLYIQSLGLSPG